MPALIFDFDGVIADSEVLANAVLAQAVTELGLPTSIEDSYRLYMGKRLADVMLAIETRLGRPLPPDFVETFQSRTLARFAADLEPVPGVSNFLDRFDLLPRCIASSSSPDRLAVCLLKLGLTRRFDPHVYSASMVPRGKPHPDLFLFAAQAMGASPGEAIVIEDSVSGVEAGCAAGMQVVGLVAAGHIQPDTALRLRAAGATAVVRDYDELTSWLSAKLAG